MFFSVRSVAMALDYSLVKFKGKSGRSNYLVLTRDVKGFKPKSLEDITDKEYMVKWQDSFHDEDADLHHNGCYPATVLLVGGESASHKSICDLCIFFVLFNVHLTSMQQHLKNSGPKLKN